MKQVYPDYAEQVEFFAVGVDPTESLKDLEEYAEREGYPWRVAEAGPGMLRALRIFQQSTKIAVDASGAIIYRDGYGRGDPDTWHQVFRKLAESANK